MNIDYSMFHSVAVIAPIVPGLCQLLAPIILVATFTFVVAIPRWFLVFAHWLWYRLAPQSLLNRTIPGVRSRTFQGVAVRQFADEYSFSIPDQADVKERISSFYKRRGAKADDDGSTFTFSRGNRLCTYFLPHIIPWREREFLQKITVETAQTIKGQIEVNVRYVVRTLCMLRLQPAGLQDEIRELYKELGPDVAA